jgi:hypothetical protein
MSGICQFYKLAHLLCFQCLIVYSVPSHGGDDVHDGCTHLISDADGILGTDISHFRLWMYVQSKSLNF